MRTPELIVAMDVPSPDAVPAIVNDLGDSVSFYKVGLELFTAAGPETIDLLTQQGKRVFLDLKLHDIPQTVANAVKTAARHRVALLTLHAGGGRDMLKAAAEASAEIGPSAPKLVAVTVLTSLNDSDLADMGISGSVSEHALRLGELAIACGIDGLVCSVHEASMLRAKLGVEPILVTPGIRPAGTAVGDQKRVATPHLAVKSGSDFLVVGRPIMTAPSRREAAQTILEAMRA